MHSIEYISSLRRTSISFAFPLLYDWKCVHESERNTQFIRMKMRTFKSKGQAVATNVSGRKAGAVSRIIRE